MGEQNICSPFGVTFPSFVDSLLRVSVANRPVMRMKNKNLGEHSKTRPFHMTATAMVSYCLASVSFLTMTVLGLDRFYAVKLRHRYRQVVTFRCVAMTLTGCWIFGIAWSFIWLVSESIISVIVITLIFCCIITTSVSSVRTYLEIRHHQRQIHARTLQQQGVVVEGRNLYCHLLLWHVRALCC